MLPISLAARRLAVLAVCALALAACDGGASDDAPTATDLIGRFATRGRYTPLVSALALAGVDRDIAQGPVTILAPTETALRYIGADFSPVLFAEPQRATLARVLRHHIIARRLAPEDFADGATFTSLAGTTLTVRRIGPVVTVNGITVDVTDAVEGTNGVAYPAADVLLDVLTGIERIRLSPLLSQLANGLRGTGVDAEVANESPVTLLAPINDGFIALGAASLTLLNASANTDVFRRVLRTQTLPGDVDLNTRVGQTVTALSGDRLPVARDSNQVLTVGGVRVVDSDLTRDGRVYILAGPILSTLSVSERLRVRGELSRFAADVARLPEQSAALADRGRQVTVFAPTNAAYAARGTATEGVLAGLPGLRVRATAVHVVYGRYALADLTDGLQLTATDGTVLRVLRDGNVVQVGNLIVDAPNVQPNGVIYSSGAFMLPNVDLLDTVLLSGFSAYYQAVRATGIETEFRASVRTAFVVPDAIAPALTSQSIANQRAILRRTASTELIPDIARVQYPRVIQMLSGTRTLNTGECTLAVLRTDPACSQFGFEPGEIALPQPNGTIFRYLTVLPQLYPGGVTQNGTGAFQRMRSVDAPM